jgi:hypothetical protein
MSIDYKNIRGVPNISSEANQCFADVGKGMCVAPAFGVLPDQALTISAQPATTFEPK